MDHKNSSEEIKRYEKEFSEFLIEKINHAGGSLQFQHLSGILQQLRFEVRNAVASSKPELMKFLRTHTKIFKIDSKGVVSVVNSVSLEERSDVVGDDDDNGINNNTEKDGVVPVKKGFHAKINNGEGTVVKVNPQFAIINAVTPIRTHVYFTPSEYGADKDSLFGLDIDLRPSTEVFFNAEHGHSDYGIEYRATKVWCKPNSDDENTDTQNHKKNKNVEKLSGEGIVEKIYPNFGVISVFDRKAETVLFYKSNVQNSNTDVAKFLEVGDHVEFTAELDNEGSKAKWVALNVIKKTKPSCNQPSSDFAGNIKNDVTYSKKNRIENHPGKIYAYADGAIIKFGKDQKADGDSSDYYLYGNKVKVSDIIWEFSEGDDVLFDAVKVKKLPGWKAYLVWIGKKPACRNIPKVDDDSDEIIEEQSSSSVVSSDSSNSLLRSKTTYSKYSNPENKQNKKSSTIYARSSSKKSDKFQDEYKKENHSKTKRNDQNISVNVSKFKKANYKSDKRSLTSNNFAKNKHRNALLTEDSNYTVKSKRNLLASVESASNIHIENSEDSSEDDDEFHDATSNPRKFLIEEKYNSSSSEEINQDTESNEVIQNNENELMSKKASIKKFEDIEGEIISVICKAAIIRCSLLKRDVDFVLSAFYLDGESAEERQVIDLKEIIQVGDTVNFNCFEIIDDYGNLSQKVTVAWMGPKPEVYETTPEDFIRENELSVSLCADMDECRPESRNEVNHTEFKSSENPDETAGYYSETESTVNIMLDDKLNKSSDETERKISENPNDSDHSSVTEDDEESLSNKIVRKLKMHGFFSEDSQIDLRIVHEIIDLVLEKNRIANSSCHTLNQDRDSSEVFCSSCLSTNISFSNKAINSKEAAVQTIITGEIIASRNHFRTMKKREAKYSSG